MDKKLFTAIRQDNFIKLRQGITKSPMMVHQKDVAGMTLLMRAAALGRFQCVNLLLDRGADVHVLDNTMGQTALHLACQGGDVETVRLLLKAGAFINLQAEANGITPLINAIWYRNTECVEFLLAQPRINIELKTYFGVTAQEMLNATKATNDCERDEVRQMQKVFENYQQNKIEVPLIDVLAEQGLAFEEHPQYLDKYIDQAQDINQQTTVCSSRYDCHTALHVAARDGLAKTCERLLKLGADVAVQDAYMHSTPIHKAAYMGHADVIKVLSTANNFHETVDEQGPYNGYTALHDAIWHGHVDAARALIDAGAKRNLRGHDGLTPLDLAVMYEYEEIVELFELEIA